MHASFWDAFATTPVLYRNDTIYHGLIWFSHILRLRAAPFSHSKSTRKRSVHQKLLSSLFLCHFWSPSDAQGRPKAGTRSPNGTTRSPQGIPGTPKNRHKIILGHQLLTQGRPGGSRRTHRKEISSKSIKKHCLPTTPRV